MDWVWLQYNLACGIHLECFLSFVSLNHLRRIRVTSSKANEMQQWSRSSWTFMGGGELLIQFVNPCLFRFPILLRLNSDRLHACIKNVAVSSLSSVHCFEESFLILVSNNPLYSALDPLLSSLLLFIWVSFLFFLKFFNFVYLFQIQLFVSLIFCAFLCFLVWFAPFLTSPAPPSPLPSSFPPFSFPVMLDLLF